MKRTPENYSQAKRKISTPASYRMTTIPYCRASPFEIPLHFFTCHNNTSHHQMLPVFNCHKTPHQLNSGWPSQMKTTQPYGCGCFGQIYWHPNNVAKIRERLYIYSTPSQWWTSQLNMQAEDVLIHVLGLDDTFIQRDPIKMPVDPIIQHYYRWIKLQHDNPSWNEDNCSIVKQFFTSTIHI